LERRDAAGEDEVRDALAVGVAAKARADDGLVIDRVGEAEARLEEVLLHVDVTARQVVEEVAVGRK
jgi:hypothetical protein